MLQTKFIYYTVIFASVFLFSSCDDSSDTGTDNSFDRTFMLENIADNIIIPNFNNLQFSVNTLNTSIEDFIATPDEANLTTMQNDWLNAALLWQHCSAFDFGPASRPLGTLAQVVGTFPVNITKIETAISNQDFSLDNFDRDARGFMTIDYLIFDTNGNSEVLSKYDVGKADSGDRKQYLKAVIENIKSEVDDVVTQWQTYRDTFVSQNGTSTGSSTSILFNGFSANYEQIKNFKVGLPSGKRPGQSNPEPDKVEAFYSGHSLALIKEHLTALEFLWSGDSRHRSLIDGPGFEEYLNSVEGGIALVQDTKEQILQVRAALDAVPDDRLSDLINTQAGLIDNAHTEMQKLTRFFKSDMSSLLGIAITFNSGDGD